MEWLSVFRIIYFLGAVNALFFSALIFSKRQKSLADKILAWWLIILSLQVLYPFLYLVDMVKYQRFIGYEACLSFLHPAGLFFYTKAMVGQLRMVRKTIILLGLLFLLVFGVFVFMSHLPDNRLILFNDHNFLKYFDPATKILVITLFVLFVALYGYFLIRSNHLLKEYKKKIHDVYSHNGRIDLFWLRKLIVFFYTSYAITLVSGGIILVYDGSLAYTDYIYYMMMVVFVFLIGYWGHQQGSVFKFEAEEKFERQNISEEKAVPFSNNNSKQFGREAKVLKRIMEDEKPFLEPMLTIHDLANRLEIPAHLLSKVIHKEFGKNFYEFINCYRIESFKRRVVSMRYQNYTLLAIAFECGFNSKSAFNRIFKEQTGLTPRDYKLKAKSYEAG